MLKLGFRLSMGIQHRVLVIPWVKRHSMPPRILCSAEKRDYTSSGLSRYVPKKSRGVSEQVTSQPLDTSEKGTNASSLDQSVSESIKPNGDSKEARKDMYMDLQERTDDAGSYMNVSLDGSDEGTMSLEKGMSAGRWDHCVPGSKGNFREAGAGTYSHLKVKNDAGMFSNVSCDDDSGEELEESSDDGRSTRQHKQVYDEIKLYMDAETAKSSKETQEAENMAIRYLGLRAYTAVELKKKLIGKKYPLEIVDKVINDFQHRGFINDNFYAEAFTRSRWSSLSWGPRRIKQALFKKGVSNEDSDAAIKLVFEKDHQCKETEPSNGMSKEAMDQLYVQASKRWLQGRDLPIENRKARVIRWLQYRGFNWGVVSQLIKRLESPLS
ncbi:Regulatory protein RecX family protein [Hirschfeldia incana]|nr:Regulatory protein RecX family protein [Hirschfeldia incana]